MNCRSAENLFSSFVEDGLSQRERRALESHLEECTRCSAAVQELRVTVDLLSALPEFETGPAFEEEIMDRIRSGEAMRPSVVEWLSEHLGPVRLRPVFLVGAAGCAAWIAVMALHPFQGATPELASTKTVVEQPSVASNPGVAPAAGAVTAPAPAGEVVASAPSPSRMAPATSGSAPAALETTASGPADSARINAPYQDEYILDQFYLNRSGEDGVHSIVPVSGRTTDDVYITF